MPVGQPLFLCYLKYHLNCCNFFYFTTFYFLLSSYYQDFSFTYSVCKKHEYHIHIYCIRIVLYIYKTLNKIYVYIVMLQYILFKKINKKLK